MNKSKYNQQVNIRVTGDQLKVLKLQAKLCGLSVSKYIRKISTEKNPRFLSDNDRQEIKELKNVGLEIKRALNLYHEKRSDYVPFLKQFRDTISKFSKL